MTIKDGVFSRSKQTPTPVTANIKKKNVKGKGRGERSARILKIGLLKAIGMQGTIWKSRS